MSLRRLPYALLALLGALFCTLPASSTCTDCDGDGYEWPVDCNDADPDIYPGAPEACDGFDNDCDGSLDNDPACSTLCEFPGEIDDEFRLSPQYDPGQMPAMTWNSSEFAIVWEASGNIFLTRINSAGNEIGTEVRANPGAGGDCSQPDLVWTGSEYGLVWRCVRTLEQQILFARLDSTGGALSPDVQITTHASESAFPRLVWTGQEYGVVWQDDRDGNWEIYFTRVDAAANPVGDVQRITDDGGSSLAPALVWAGGEYGVVWQDDRDGNREIYFARLDATGTKLTGDLRVTDDPAVSEAPELAWTGSEYGVVWQDDRDGQWDNDWEVYFALLNAGGTKVGSDVLVTNLAGRSGGPRIQWIGSDYGVAWWNEDFPFRGIFVARLDGLGSTIGEPVSLIGDLLFALSMDPVLVWTGTSYGVAWEDNLNGMGIYFSRIGCDCLDLDGDSFTPCSGDCDEEDETVFPGAPQLCDGVNSDCENPYWPAPPPDETDSDADGLSECEGDCDDTRDTVRPGLPEVCDLLDNDCNGETDEGYDLDGDGFTSCGGDCDDASAVVYPKAPQVCDGLNNDCDHPSWPELSGTEEMEDWDGDGLTGCAGDCDVHDPATHPGAAEICDARDNDCDGEIDELLPCPLSCDTPNDVILPNRRVTGDYYSTNEPVLVSAGAGFGLAWWGKNVSVRDFIYFARVDAAGNMVGGPTRVTTDPWANSYRPDVVWTGMEFGLVWDDDRDGDYEIYFSHVDAAGLELGDDVRVSDAPGGSTLPSIAWNGSGYGVVWQDDRHGNDEIYLARLDASGSVLGGEVRLTTDSGSSEQPRITWTGSGYAVAWQDNRDGNREIYLVLVDAGGSSGGSIRLTDDPGISLEPQIAWSGSELGVLWIDDRDGQDELYFVRLDSSGARLTADIQLTDNPASVENPRLSWTGGEYGVAWQDHRDGNAQIYFTRLDPGGTKLIPALRVSEGPAVAESPGLAWTGSAYGAAWVDHSSYYKEIYFARVGCECVDDDGDGYTSCNECDDTNGAVYPGAPQVCDGLNNDCDDPAWPLLDGTNEADDDLDGLTECDGDCDDRWFAVHPGMSEICDFLDNDCDASIDEDFDLDLDGWATCSGDCDDGDAAVHPGAPQICDGLNNDCAHTAGWPTLAGTNDGDDDGDGLTECGGDCDDGQATVRPGLPEICDLLDNDCNGETDEGYDQDADGFTSCGGDCDDGNDTVFPAAPQNCDGLNNNCDHPAWPALSNTNENDDDGDGLTGCEGDCDVLDPFTYPVATEICDGRDNDCDGEMDESLTCPLSCTGPDEVGSDRRVTESTGYPGYPSLTAAGSGFGLTWQDNRHGGYEVYFSHLDETGDIVAGPVRVTDAAGSAYRPTLAWSGSEFGLVWHDSRDGGYEIYFNRLDAAGVKLGNDVHISNSSGDAEYPVIAWNGSGYGVVWMDDRDGNDQVYFVRLDPAGNVLKDEVRLSSAFGSSYFPQIAWTGTHHAVTWNDDQHSNRDEIYVAMVNAQGHSSEPLRITDSPGEAVRPHIAWSGTELGILWIDDRDGQRELYFVRLDGAGARLTGDIRLTDDPATIYEPRVIWTGGEYGVAWGDHRDGNGQIYFTRLDPSGVKLIADLRISEGPTASQYPGLAWTGAIYGMGWHDERHGAEEIYFTRIRCDCTDADGDGFTGCNECDDTNGTVYPGAPRICDGLNNDCRHTGWPELAGTDEVEDRDGDGLTACEGDCDVLDPSTRIGAVEICDARDNDCDGEIDESLTCPPSCAVPDKVIPDVRVTDSTGGAYYPSMVSTGPGFGLAWQDSRHGGDEVYFARLDEVGGVVAGPTRVTDSADHAYRPALAWTGAEFALAWHDGRDGDTEIYFTHFDASGLEIGDGVRVSDSPGDARHPVIAWSGSEYGVAWMDDRDGNDEIYFARLDLAGNVLGGEVRLTSSGGDSSFPRVAWSGSQYAVTWYNDGNGNNEIYVALVDADGSSSVSRRITADPGESIHAQIAWSGSELGILWIDDRDGQRELYFARLDANGVPLTGDIRLTQDPADIYSPRLIWTGGEYGVAWRDRRDGYGQIYFTRLDAGGTKLTPDLRISENPASSLYPALAWTGSVYGIAWHDARHGLSEIYFTHVRCDCSVDGDGDGYTFCRDCEDTNGDVFPRADEVCDGVNNDCLHAEWPSLNHTPEWDDDLDGYAECEGDCDDSTIWIAPGAPQTCDGVNNDCLHPSWPLLDGTNEWSDDGDGFSECGGDCDDADGNVFPFAPQLCDGVNNDCYDASWPLLTGTNEDDVDGDGLTECGGDNCPAVANPGQLNSDGDARGDVCDCIAGDPEVWVRPARYGTCGFPGHGPETRGVCGGVRLAIRERWPT